MLSNHYEKILVGNNYISLIVGIIKSYENKTLIIDDSKVHLGRGWYQYIGETEKKLLNFIGQRFDIAPLLKIERYIVPVNTIIHFNDKMIELTDSCADNVRELVRKLPVFFNLEMLTILEGIDDEAFNQHCTSVFEQIAVNSYMENTKLEVCIEQVLKDPVLSGLYQNILNLIQSDNNNLELNQFNFVLQILFQTIFSNRISKVEAVYLLTSMISPRYKIDEARFVEDLIFEFKQNGGDLRQTSVAEWEIYKGKLESILLDSYEGVLGLDQLYFFGNLPEKMPFSSKVDETLFNSIDLKIKLDHPYLDNLKNKRILFSKKELLGSDCPYWEIFVDEDKNISATYSYASYQGSKPEFYFGQAKETIFSSLANILPGLDINDFKDCTEVSAGKDIWMEMRKKTGNSNLQLLKANDYLYDVNNKSLKSISYWGPLKAKSLGLMSYLVDLKVQGHA